MCHTLFSVDDTQNETENCPLRSVTDHLSDLTAATDHAFKLVGTGRWVAKCDRVPDHIYTYYRVFFLNTIYKLIIC